MQDPDMALAARSNASTESTKRALWDSEEQTKQETPKRVKQSTESCSTEKTPNQFISRLSKFFAQSKEKPVVTPKRSDYLCWDDYFLAVAALSSKRSKDPQSPSGACIVDERNRVVAVGYNGLPWGCPDEIFPWMEFKQGSNVDWLHTKDPYVCHAVSNAVMNKCSHDVAHCRIYVTDFPTSDCAKVIIQSFIEEVIVLDSDKKQAKDNEETTASRILLEMAGVRIREIKPQQKFISLDFQTLQTSSEEQQQNRETVAESELQKEVDPKHEIAKALLKTEAKYHATSVVGENKKRKDYLSWEDYFMAMAFLTAHRSKDPNTQVGACIVGKNKIIGLGYNGFPQGCSDDELPWARCNSNKLHNKYLYVCHAEANAIHNKGSADVRGATIYVALFPCHNCAKMIIQAGIREVVYLKDHYHDEPSTKASRIMLQCAGVKLRHFVPSAPSIVLEL